ncbi:unnamed protein product [Spodoptera littoralis]|uniref:Vesicle transport protein n=1 Tax=Spodoptera littoralis TaxID=7109 RepID=A0A9P0I7H8_SPOLI|nr:unnamed protein product [Spodoptera littoralis]CAH1642503.1 unnamed protein product [Spodoptera littoralis]
MGCLDRIYTTASQKTDVKQQHNTCVVFRRILFISGLACVIGLQRTFFFFFQRHKIKASVAFFGGITIVLMGWPMIGMIAEIYGFLLLFSCEFPKDGASPRISA